MKKMILASSSSVYGSLFLEYLQPQLQDFFSDVSELLFIPYARPSGLSYDEYTASVQKGFEFMNLKVRGIHTYKDPIKAIENSKGIFIGGGNTFVLVDTLYKLTLWDVLKQKIESGIPYLGTSAGSNICGVSMKTTNDMPIVLPKSYETLGLIPFNINAHYLEPLENSRHKGETRETRIKEFHVYNDTPVIGLKEGSWLRIDGDSVLLNGGLSAILFEKGKEKIEYKNGTEFQTVIK